MHSADYAVTRYLCLSVCLSFCHTPVLCLNGYTYPQKFLPSGSPTILVFANQTRWQYFDGDLLTGASDVRGVWKNHDFWPISHFILQMMPKLSNGTSLNDLQWPFQGHDYSTSNNLKMVQHTAIHTMADQWKVVYDLSNGAISNDLERPLSPVSRSHRSLTLNILLTVRDTDIVSIEY